MAANKSDEGVNTEQSLKKQQHAYWTQLFREEQANSNSNSHSSPSSTSKTNSNVLGEYEHEQKLIHPSQSTATLTSSSLFPSFLSLLSGLLCIDPEKRLTALEALKHPFFDD